MYIFLTFSHVLTIIGFIFQNVSIAVVGKDQPFTVYEDAAVDPYLELIAGEERRGGAAATAEGEGQGQQGQDEGSMDTD